MIQKKAFIEEGLIAGLVCAAVGLAVGGALLGGWGATGWLVMLGWSHDPAWIAYLADGPINRLRGLMPFAVAVISGLTAGAAGFYSFAFQREEWHHSGMEYIPDPEAFAPLLAEREAALFSEQQAAGAVAGLPIGGVQFSRIRETGHMVLVGLAGGGKTTLIMSVVNHVLQAGERIMILDPKGDYLDILAKMLPPEQLAVLGPWDIRSRRWDIAADINTPALADQFARAVFPREDGGANQFFVTAARVVLAGIVKSLQRRRGGWSWQDLAGILAAGPEAIIAAAHDGADVARTMIQDPRQTGAAAVLAELASSTAWIPDYANAHTADTPAFALRTWLTANSKTGPRVVVLNADARYAGHVETIFGAMLSVVADTIASPAMRECKPDEPGVWMIADELPQLGPAGQKALQKMEEMGRSRGVRVIKAMQDASQLYAREGREKGVVQKSMQQTRVYMKTSTDGAADVCKALGDRDIKRIELPLTAGVGNKRIVSEKAPVLRVDSLMGLQVLPGRGVEIIVQTDDLIGKLVQPFIQLPKGAGQIIPNPRWDAVSDTFDPETGEVFPAPGRAQEVGEAEPEQAPEREPEPTPTPAPALTDADLPMDLDDLNNIFER